MAQTVCVISSAADLAHLSDIVADQARPLKHIQRARIVLLSAERLSVLDVAHQAGVSRPRLALATALRRRRRRGPLARQDPSGNRDVAPAESRALKRAEAIARQLPVGLKAPREIEVDTVATRGWLVQPLSGRPLISVAQLWRQLRPSP